MNPYASFLGDRNPIDVIAGTSRRLSEIVGERWSLLIIRNAMFAGATRFTEFQRGLGVAPNILSSRLELLVEAGLTPAAAARHLVSRPVTRSTSCRPEPTMSSCSTGNPSSESRSTARWADP